MCVRRRHRAALGAALAAVGSAAAAPPPAQLVGDKLSRCGVATAAIYFPGFHHSVENSRFWGENWTEWANVPTNLIYDAVQKAPIRHPRSYYDIGDGGQTLRKQAQQARQAGLKAFVFYHYWFGLGRTVLSKPLEDTLLGGQTLGISFFFSWANEPWSRRWDGADDSETLIAQNYGTTSDFEAHFDYLLPFFRSREYVKIEGMPVLAIYNLQAQHQHQHQPPATSHQPPAPAPAARQNARAPLPTRPSPRRSTSRPSPRPRMPTWPRGSPRAPRARACRTRSRRPSSTCVGT